MAVAVACSLALLGGRATAQDKTAPGQPQGDTSEKTGIMPPDAVPKSSGSGGSRVITISEVTIVGRVQKPIASVDVNKISPKLTLAELRQPFLDRIEAVTKSDPF